MLRFKVLAVVVLIFAPFGLGKSALAASKEKVLHRFNYADGFRPDAPLIFDNAGNLYGTT